MNRHTRANQRHANPKEIEMTLRTLAATLLVALTTTTAFAATNPLGGPSTSGGPAIAISGGEIHSPGDPFRPQVRVPHVGTETYSMSCGIGDGKFANGGSKINLVNTSSKTIPKGATIEVTYPNGSKETFVASSDIQPGSYISMVGPAGATPDDYQCSASASGQVPADQPGPAESGAPTANSAVPPKLVCWFEVVDGKVIIYWKNQGGSAVPSGTEVIGKNAAGIGVSVLIANPIEPGETKSLQLDADPSLAIEACKASFG